MQEESQAELNILTDKDVLGILTVLLHRAPFCSAQRKLTQEPRVYS